MASSYSSLQREFDVFLSFCRVDARKRFISRLSHSLDLKDTLICKGEGHLVRASSIFQAIERSRVAVVVMSPNYATCSGCLEQLAKIMECHEKGLLTVLPIFYGVDPSHVRKKAGKFAEAFERYKGIKNPKLLQRWMEALTDLTCITGVVSQNWSEESSMIKNIIATISTMLMSTALRDLEGLVGVDVHMETMNWLLRLESENEFRLVAICGEGGVGKTTLAKYVYKHISRHFQTHLFIENVKKIYRDQGPSGLQKKFHSKNIQERVLLVADDLDEIEQLEALIKISRRLGPGSRVIITAQDKGLLVACGIECAYRVERLQYNEALELFRQFAFSQKHPLIGFEELSDHAVRLAGRLPLALILLGSCLCGKDTRYWERTLLLLERSPDKSITQLCKICYDSLDEPEKSLLLFIACFFNGEHVDSVIRSVDNGEHNARTGIEVLVQKSFVSVRRDGCVSVHDLVQDMAKKVAQQSTGKGNSSDACQLKLLKWRRSNDASMIEVITETTSTKRRDKGSVTALPTFGEMDPSDVKKQAGKFVEAFEKHEGRENPEKVQRWRKALTDPICIPGKQSRHWEEDPEQMDEINDNISNKLFSPASIDVSGLGERVRSLEKAPTELALTHEGYSLIWEEDSEQMDEINDNISNKLFSPASLDVSGLGEIDVRTEAMLELSNLESYNEIRMIGICGKHFSGERVRSLVKAPTKLASTHEECSQIISSTCVEDPRAEDSEINYNILNELFSPASLGQGESVRSLEKAPTELALTHEGYSRIWEEDPEQMDEINENISTKLFSSASLEVSGLIGMDVRMEAMLGLLNLESSKEIRMVGIWGAGGIGKTSLARYVYEHVSSCFQSYFFQEGMKKIDQDYDLSHLQEELSKNLQGALTIRSSYKGSENLKARLRHQRVLLVADDVDRIEQLDVVGKAADWLGPGSRVIVTTRDKDLLVAYGIIYVYEVECLGHSEALQLFCQHAFKQNHPYICFEQLSDRAVKLAGGLPLALILLGSFLRDRGEDEWQSSLDRLEASTFKDIAHRIKVSPSKLIEEDKSTTDIISSKSSSPRTSDCDGLVAMDRHMKEMYRLLDLESNNEFCMIGISGIEGVGKMTLARYVYEEISSTFQNHCFLENVKKIHQNHGPLGLQEELLLKNLQGEPLKMRSSIVGYNDIKARLGDRKVLFVIDGVDKIEQLDVVAKDASWFGSGSRVIVTSKDKSLLVSYGIKHVYEVGCLRYDEALELFSQSAFKKKCPPIGFEELSVRSVQLVGRLPLGLKLLGSFLHGKSEEDWENVLHGLEATLDEDTLKLAIKC